MEPRKMESMRLRVLSASFVIASLPGITWATSAYSQTTLVPYPNTTATKNTDRSERLGFASCCEVLNFPALFDLNPKLLQLSDAEKLERFLIPELPGVPGPPPQRSWDDDWKHVLAIAGRDHEAAWSWPQHPIATSKLGCPAPPEGVLATYYRIYQAIGSDQLAEPTTGRIRDLGFSCQYTPP